MTRTRPLTEIEQTRYCTLCGANPGERCSNPSGTWYATGIHSPRRNGTAGASFVPPSRQEQVTAYFRLLIKLATSAEGEHLKDLFDRIERTLALAEELAEADALAGQAA